MDVQQSLVAALVPHRGVRRLQQLSSTAPMISLTAAPWQFVLVLLSNSFVKAVGARPCFWPAMACDDAYCLGWRVMVEANNAKGWRTVPAPCVGYVKAYMNWGQYTRDLNNVVDQIAAYADQIAAAADGLDAWVLDVDDTCLSNMLYYEARQFGAYDPLAFKMWAGQAACPAIPAVRRLFETLKDRGFRVFVLSGRDEETLGSCTAANLDAQGFSGYERLVMRSPDFRGMSSVVFKSAMRNQLVDEGYRIRGNVGDQWSDLQGDCVGDRVFKVPNPMYFVP